MPTKQTFTAGQVLTAAQMNTLQDYTGVVQVVTVVKNDTFTMSSTTWTDITGLSASITPTSASNRILILAHLMGSNGSADVGGIRFVRGSTTIGVPATAGNRMLVSFVSSSYTGNNPNNYSMAFIDSPATTSATTYKLQIASGTATAQYINRSGSDTDTFVYPRGISTLILLEVTP